MTALNSWTNVPPRLLPACAAAGVVAAILLGGAASGRANLDLSLSVRTGRSFLHVELGSGSTPVPPAPAGEGASHVR